MLSPAMNRGESLRDELERRYAAGGYFTLAEAVTAMVPLVTSLAEHHDEGVLVHIHPSAIRFRAGGCSLDLAAAGEPATLDRDQVCLAPEQGEGEVADPRAAVFAIGVILYEMVTGESVGAGMRRPSEIAPEVPEAFERLLDNAMLPDPEVRSGDLRALADALRKLAANSAVATTADTDDDGFDVDLESSVSLLPPARSEAPRPAATSAPATSTRPVTASVRPESTPTAVSAPPRLEAAKVSPAPRGPKGTTERLAELKARLEADPRPRYIVVKDGMDHGPFTAVELLHQIAIRAFVPEHALLDSVTKEERPIADWPDFAPFAEQAERTVAAEQEKKDLAAEVTADTARNRYKTYVAFGVALLGVAALAALYFRFGRARNDEVVIRLGQAQNVDFEGGVAKGKGGRAGGGKGGRNAGGTKSVSGQGSDPGSADDAGDGAGDAPSDSGGTTHPVVPDGLSCEGAQARYVEDYSKDAPPDLTAGAYGAVLNRGDYLNSCGVPPTMAVSICAAVQNGRAVGVSVSTTPPNGSIARCISGQVRSLSFPSHPRLDVSRTNFAAQCFASRRSRNASATRASSTA
jgi:hypothetical protein